MSTLFLAVVGTVECARALWTYNTMLVAVEQAGRYAMTSNYRPPAVCSAQVQAAQCPALSTIPQANCAAWYARQVLGAYRAPGVAVSAALDAATSPPTMTICASYSFDFVAPQLLPYGPIQLTSRVTVPVL
jgi:Flp pilus assembly protein TadG